MRCQGMAGEREVADKAQVKLASSAAHLEQSAEVQTDSADRRTELAADRTVLAAERTYAAWVRTGLAALASGIGARALLEKVVPDWLIGATGSVLILFSGFCTILNSSALSANAATVPSANSPWLDAISA